MRAHAGHTTTPGATLVATTTNYTAGMTPARSNARRSHARFPNPLPTVLARIRRPSSAHSRPRRASPADRDARESGHLHQVSEVSDVSEVCKVCQVADEAKAHIQRSWSRSRLRNAHSELACENGRLRDRLQLVEMSVVEAAALRALVADLEWALDAVRAQADDLRDELRTHLSAVVPHACVDCSSRPYAEGSD